MRLVVVSTVQGHVDPVNLPRAVYRLQDALEPAHTAESFGREAHLLVEYLDEAALAQTDLVEHGGHADLMRAGTELLTCKRHRRMQLQRLHTQGEKILFRQGKH